MHKQTSARVSTIAARIMQKEPTKLRFVQPGTYNELLADAQTLAGSCMSQDETPGQNPETFVDRLHREFNELQDRLQKLGAFLIRGAPGISDEQRELLDMQQDAMRLYHAILKLRMAGLPAQSDISEFKTTRVASEQPIGEPVEIGGHDEDRDGPIPFDG